MSWYVASLLFEAIHSDPSSAENVWEERLILLSADSAGIADELAQKIGSESGVAYAGQGDDRIMWKFRRVERIFTLLEPELRNGVEIFSRFLRASEVRSLLTKFPDTGD